MKKVIRKGGGVFFVLVMTAGQAQAVSFEPPEQGQLERKELRQRVDQLSQEVSELRDLTERMRTFIDEHERFFEGDSSRMAMRRQARQLLEKSSYVGGDDRVAYYRHPEIEELLKVERESQQILNIEVILGLYEPDNRSQNSQPESE